MQKVLLSLLVLISVCNAAELAHPESTLDLIKEINAGGLDASECYRVRDISLRREDLRVFLSGGFLVFGKPVHGRRVFALFSTGEDSGDAEVLLLPPQKGERRSLAAFTGSPNLDEHFQYGLLIFTDGTAEELLKQIHENGMSRKYEEQGAHLAATYDPVLRKLFPNLTLRLAHDLLLPAPPQSGLFSMSVLQPRLGPIQIVYDPLAREQITVGQSTLRSGRLSLNVWTSFVSQSERHRTIAPPPLDRIVSMQINSTIEPNLHQRVTAIASLETGSQPEGALMFDLSPRMHLKSVKVDGETAAFISSATLQSAVEGVMETSEFLVVPPNPLAPKTLHRIEFEHEGDVIADSGNKVYFVNSRGDWFPHRSGEFVRYELAFRWPKSLDLVATGDVVDEGVDGDFRTARRVVSKPVAIVGFNLGRYQRATSSRDGVRIEVFSNRQVERALASPRSGDDKKQAGDISKFGHIDPRNEPIPKNGTDAFPVPDPTARLGQLAASVSSAVDYYEAHFGPPILNHLSVSPIPGNFGQGFAGMIYLSTLAYLSPEERPAFARTETTFYSDLLIAHETAHQWWGNVVGIGSLQDEWIMESLANYSALMYLEKHKGRAVLDSALAEYRNSLLRPHGSERVDDVGPIIWGRRLEQVGDGAIWRAITYDKGTWIIHMLRRRMGDEAFLRMLGALRKRYENHTLDTTQFQQFAKDYTDPHLPDPKLETFFDQWVYSTGIPTIRMTSSVKGSGTHSVVSGEIIVTGVADDFLTAIPVEVQLHTGKPIIHWVRAASGSNSFRIPTGEQPSKVILDPTEAVLKTADPH